MADVSSNINLRINGDARELESEFQKIASELKDTKKQLEDAINNPLSTSVKKVDELRDKFYTASEGLKNLGENYLSGSLNFLTDMSIKLDSLGNNASINNISKQFFELQTILNSDNTILASTTSIANDIIERFNKLNIAVQEAFSGQTLNNANEQMIKLSNAVDMVIERIQENIFEKQAQDALEAAQKMEKYNNAVKDNQEAVSKMKAALEEKMFAGFEKDMDIMIEKHEQYQNTAKNI